MARPPSVFPTGSTLHWSMEEVARSRYQKVIRHGRAEWEEGYTVLDMPCVNDWFLYKAAFLLCVFLRLQLGHVGKADRNGLALVSGQSCRSGSPEGGAQVKHHV